MNVSRGVPKGLCIVLEERGMNTHKIKQEEMREILHSQPDLSMNSQE